MGPSRVRWRAPWFRWVECEQVAVSTRPRRPCPLLLCFEAPFQRDNLLTQSQRARGRVCSTWNKRTLTQPFLAPHAKRPQQDLNFFPLPQGQGSLRPAFGSSRLSGSSKRGAGCDSSGRLEAVSGFKRDSGRESI